MILIDDAGWGSLFGGVIIGVMRCEEGKPHNYTSEIIPVEQFQGDAFKNKEYFDGAANAVSRCFYTLGVRHEEKISICTGCVLDGACAWLDRNHFTYSRTKITGPLQDQIEHNLLDYLSFLGLKVDYDTLTLQERKGLFWFKSIQHLKGNVHRRGFIEERARFCKTGWATFNVWALHPYDEAKVKAKEIKAQKRRERWRSDEY
jgi:hypothetical protein